MSDVENESNVSKMFVTIGSKTLQLENIDVTSHECEKIICDACRTGRKDAVIFLLNQGYDLMKQPEESGHLFSKHVQVGI